jgi:protocatechuate 3,4-dioxygenase alpha subunit
MSAGNKSAKLVQSPSQTVGPYFAYGLTAGQYGYPFSTVVTPGLVDETTDGQPMRLVGQVFDGEGNPIDDAMIEIWQANAHGRYNHPADDRRDNRLDPDFSGFGRSGTGADPKKRFVFDTVKPGAIGDGQAPHLNMIVLMRGLLVHVFTRVYFDDEADANAADPVLRSVPEERRSTLIARREPAAAGCVYRFDIHMQGTEETVFFDM